MLGTGPTPAAAIQYIRTTVIDWCSRKVLLWHVSIKMEGGFCIQTVEVP
jgi:hypothetical protein